MSKIRDVAVAKIDMAIEDAINKKDKQYKKRLLS